MTCELCSMHVLCIENRCHLRILPRDFPKWEIVYYYFAKWWDKDVFVHINGYAQRKNANRR